jgi:hypothetical protein
MYLVLLLELKDLGQVDHRSLHTVKTLDDNQDLLPGSVRLGLTLADDLPQQILERLHVVVLERPDARPAQPNTEPDRRMVELVRNDQAALSDQGRNDGRIRCETHGRNDSVFLTDELGNEALSGLVEVQGTGFETSSTTRESVS